MKAILSTTIVALLSTALAGCWFYSRPDEATGCRKNTYGVAIAAATTENCPPADSSAQPTPFSTPPSPPLPPPSQM